MDQRHAGARAGIGDIARAIAIDREASVGLPLRLVDRGVGGCVHDQAGPRRADRFRHRLGVGDVGGLAIVPHNTQLSRAVTQGQRPAKLAAAAEHQHGRVRAHGDPDRWWAVRGRAAAR